MIVLISGTNRPGAMTLKVARRAEAVLKAAGAEVFFINLQDMPAGCFLPEAYKVKPAAFMPWQEAVWKAQGILSVLPEYNGSYPGVWKLFIDMLKFPESLVNVPAAFIGLALGEWGGLRAVEQAEMVFQYRNAHLFGRRVFIRNTKEALDADGAIKDAALADRFETQLKEFVEFSRKVGKSS
jgi:chromate reductase, NAD(P)H dehydrogenase (quinone)